MLWTFGEFTEILFHQIVILDAGKKLNYAGKCLSASVLSPDIFFE